MSTQIVGGDRIVQQTCDLNLIPGGAPVRVHASQYDDESRNLCFNLYSGPEPFTYTQDCTARVEGIKPDGKGFSCGLTAQFDGDGLLQYLYCTLNRQMTAVAGDVRCQLVITRTYHTLNASVDMVIGTAPFILSVERAARPDGTDMSETEISSVVEAADQAAFAAQAARDAVNTLEEKKDALDASTSAANTAKTDLQSATGTANTVRTNLVSATNTGNTARSNLQAATTAANTAKTNLTNVTSTANEAKTALNTANQTAEENLEALNSSAAMAQKIPKVAGAAAGNLAVLKADGTLQDSGKKPTPADLGALPGAASTVSGCYFRTVDGVNEWINPPMELGVEYRTTERFMGEVVYTKCISVGNLPNNSVKIAKFCDQEATAVRGSLVGYSGSNGNITDRVLFPMFYQGLEYTWYTSINNLVIQTNGDASVYAGYFTVWYVKG